MQTLDGWDVAKGLWAAVVSLFSYIGLRQIARIDKLEDVSVEQAEHEKDVDRIREEHLRTAAELKAALREHRQETQESFARIFRRLDEIADRVRDR
jgi:type VI protein secretion system component VasK